MFKPTARISDSISYYSTIMGTMCLNLTAFPLSIRNSPVALAHLMKKTHILQVFVSSDPAMQRLIIEAREILRKEHGCDVEVLSMICFDDVRDRDEDEPSVVGNEDGSANVRVDVAVALEEELALPKIDLGSTAVIFHSSGTLRSCASTAVRPLTLHTQALLRTQSQYT